jgi:hypothetical protein
VHKIWSEFDAFQCPLPHILQHALICFKQNMTKEDEINLGVEECVILQIVSMHVEIYPPPLLWSMLNGYL